MRRLIGFELSLKKLMDRFDIGLALFSHLPTRLWSHWMRQLCLQVPEGDSFEGQDEVAVTDIARRPFWLWAPLWLGT